VHSAQQDYLGYYNGNGIEQANDLDNKIPTLYFHKNQGRLSILPFQRKDGTFTKLIQGNFSLEPNSKSLTGILKKVTLPTGGTTEFEYENNRFLLNGVEYLAGGARIKKQTINDDNGQSRILHYEYRDNGRPSGTINNIPVYGQIWGFDTSNTNNMAFVSFDKPKNEIELTDGAFIGYSKVKVFEQGNGYTDYSFTSSKDFPNEEIINKTIPNNRDVCTNILHQNSSFPNVAYIDNDLKRGKLISKNVYNSSNMLLQSQSNEYNHTVFNEEIIPFQRFINNYHDDPYYTRPEGLATNYENKLRVERNLLSKEEIKEYLNGGVVTNKKEFIYDPIYPFVKEEIIYNSKDEPMITEYIYPHELWSDYAGDREIYSDMESKNILSLPIFTKQKINNTYTDEIFNFYGKDKGNIVLKEVYEKRGKDIKPHNFYEDLDKNPKNRKVIYNSHDNLGNITQYTPENGIPTAIIWGYNGQHPVAKLEGITFDIAVSKLKGYLSKLQNGILTKDEQKTLRVLIPEAMITTYVYKPLVGVTQITGANGISEHYKYDETNRLEEIKNDKGEVLKTFEYNYKN